MNTDRAFLRIGRLRLFAAISLVAGAIGCFPHEAGPRLAHFETTAPAVGEPAPGFSLENLAGEEVELHDLIGEKPIVLQLGSHSCPVYRYRRSWVRELYEDFGERVHFLLVYTQEAHPVGSESPFVDREWDLWINKLTGVRVRQAEDEKGRRAQAQQSRERLNLAPTVLVDDLDNAVWQAYGAASSPAFVIDFDGRVAARHVWIEPKQIRRVLEALLADVGQSSSAARVD